MFETERTKPEPITIPSIHAFKRHGIPRSMVHGMSLNLFHFHESMRDLLEKYYILYWSGNMLKGHLKDGMITHQDTSYIAVFKNCTFLQATRAQEVFVSFRKPVKEYDLPAYVLIKVAPVKGDA